jgi:hypothetical protein
VMSYVAVYSIFKNVDKAHKELTYTKLNKSSYTKLNKSYRRSTDYFDACQQNKALVCRLTSIFWTIGFIYVDAN